MEEDDETMATLALAILLAMAVLALAILAMAVECLWKVEEDVLSELRRGPRRFEDGNA